MFNPCASKNEKKNILKSYKLINSFQICLIPFLPSLQKVVFSFSLKASSERQKSYFCFLKVSLEVSTVKNSETGPRED
jgi:hypothetical protein